MAVYQKIELGNSKIAVPPQKLIVNKELPFDVYTEDNGGYKLLFLRGAAFNSSAEATLTEKEIAEVYISAEDQGALDAYLSEKQPETKPLKINPALFE